MAAFLFAHIKYFYQSWLSWK